MVITSYTGTVVVLNKGPWVRIPLTPPSKKREANCLSKNMKKEEKMELKQIVEPLIKWYEQEGRKLPWREGKNPYHIWISEIMLQQTKIEAVKKYYDRFIQELPTIQDLAKVEEDKLLKLWEGLGYYNRARNLKKAAIQIEEKFNGKMPKTYQDLITLAGIGEYTAGAISSIAFNQKVPAVDGNVLRVLSRVIKSKKDVLLPETKKEMTRKIQEILPKQAGTFNEAIMELGETICIPNGEPLCDRCPLANICLAKKENLVMQIPVRMKKTKRKKEEITVFLLKYKNKIAIQKREQNGLLAGMYEFPNQKEKMTKKKLEEYLKQKKIIGKNIKKVGTHKHIFTHIEWNMTAYEIETQEELKGYLWIQQKELKNKYALPTAFAVFQKYIK